MKDHEKAVATFTVPGDWKVMTKEGKTVINGKGWTGYLWVVPDSDSVEKALPKVGKVIEGEFKDFVVEKTEKVTVAGADAKELSGKGTEADDGDPGTADVVVFAMGKSVLVSCVHGEDQAGPQERPFMLVFLKTAKNLEGSAADRKRGRKRCQTVRRLLASSSVSAECDVKKRLYLMVRCVLPIPFKRLYVVDRFSIRPIIELRFRFALNWLRLKCVDKRCGNSRSGSSWYPYFNS